MQKLNCLIIEDEPLAAEVLKDYINDIPGLKLEGICYNAFEATEKLRSVKIDVLFVDINLPKINGIDFIKSLKDPYQVIFTTAYHQHAIEGFNLNAVDYLLKPIEFSRFLQATNKLFDKFTAVAPQVNVVTSERKFRFFNVDKKQVKVFLDEIVYIESLKDYVKIHTANGTLITKFQIGEMEKLLEGSLFLRAHKSFIVNTNKITAYSANELELDKALVPIGRNYKENIDVFFKENNRLKS